MIGLMVLAGLAIYVTLLICVTRASYCWAKRRKMSKAKCWVIAGGGFLLVYLPLFWDLVPTAIAHKYYCERDAGFWEYLPLEQWKLEHPDTIGNLSDRLNKPSATSHDNRYRHWISSRLFMEVLRQPKYAHAIAREEQVLYDVATKQPIARSVNYWRGQAGNVISLGGTFEEIRQSLVLSYGNRQCGDPSPTDSMQKLQAEYWGLNDPK